MERTSLDPRRCLRAALLLFAAGCGDPAPEVPSVLLVSFDTTRADRIGCYGGPAGVTPALDGLAARGVRFLQAHSPVPLTLPAHTSLLTGLQPPRHGVRANGAYRLPDSVPTLATLLAQHGHATAAFVGAYVLDARFGLDRGFELYDDAVGHAGDPGAHLYAERTAAEVAAVARTWFEGLGERPFFAWVHFFDPHYPYRPPPGWVSPVPERPYESEIAFADAQLGRLLAQLERLGRLADTLVVVTADHGEGLGEHGEQTHGHLLYESTTRVPLVLTHPSLPAGRERSDPATLVDVVPTILAFVGVAESQWRGLDGRDLFAAAEPDAGSHGYLESEQPRIEFGFRPLTGWFDGRYKLLEFTPPQLFDLAQDPAESRDVAAEHPARVESLRRRIQAVRRSPAPAAALEATAEVRRRLEALGYATAQADAPVTRPAWTPAELVGLIALRDRGKSLFFSNRLDEAGGVFLELIRLAPESPVGHLFLGLVLARQERYAEARPSIEEALRLQFEEPEAHWNLAVCLHFLGESAKALEELEITIRLDPNHPQARRKLAEFALAAGDLTAARSHLQTLVDLGGETQEVAWARSEVAKLQREGRW